MRFCLHPFPTRTHNNKGKSMNPTKLLTIVLCIACFTASTIFASEETVDFRGRLHVVVGQSSVNGRYLASGSLMPVRQPAPSVPSGGLVYPTAPVNAPQPVSPEVFSIIDEEETEFQKLLKSNASVELSCKPDGIWSGTWDDLNAIVANAERMYGFENTKHLGRNATLLIPATKGDMDLMRLSRGNMDGWYIEKSDGYHHPKYKKGDNRVTAIRLSGKGAVVKYINPTGGEVVYNAETGAIVLDEHLGTKNFRVPGKKGYGPWQLFTGHKKWDMQPHEKNDQYKYAGILVEVDPHNQDIFYIVDGQTGKRMTVKEVEDFPTTLSDMWKDMGLVCVANDAEDVITPPDISKLEALLQWKLSFLQTLLANGELPTFAQLQAYNSNAVDIIRESKIFDQELAAMPISDEDKTRLEEQVDSKFMPYVQQILELIQEAESKKLITSIQLIKEGEDSSMVTGEGTNGITLENAGIDISALESLLNRQITLCQSVLAKGVHATPSQVMEINRCVSEIERTAKTISQQIENLSIPANDKQSLVSQFNSRIVPYFQKIEKLAEELDSKQLMRR